MLWDFDPTVNFIGAAWLKGCGLLWEYVTRMPRIKGQRESKDTLLDYRGLTVSGSGDPPQNSLITLGNKGISSRSSSRGAALFCSVRVLYLLHLLN